MVILFIRIVLNFNFEFKVSCWLIIINEVKCYDVWSYKVIKLNYWIISSAGSPLASKIFALGKSYYPLTTAQDDRFATGCENIVSLSQTSSLLPPPPPPPRSPWWAICFGTWKKIYMLTKWLHSSSPRIITCANCIAANRPSEKDFSTIFCRQSHCSFSQAGSLSWEL